MAHKVYQLEVTSLCNLACSFCARDKMWAHKEQGHMDLALLDRIDWGDTEYTELQMSGEPTLHPRLKDITMAIKEKGIKVGLSTNSTFPKIDLSYVDIITNTIDIERSKTLKEKYPTQVYMQKLGENYPYEDVTHSKPMNDPVAFDCKTPFNYVSIHWDGDVVPCCKCFGKQHVFGNLYDQTMEEILNSKKRKDFLDKLSGGKKHPYICGFCVTPNPHKIHDKLLEWKKSQ